MEIRVLGCSGGIGGPGRRTTALLVDGDLLIDCGTGVGELSLEALQGIDHVFLTHSHLDHLALLPMLLDSVAECRSRPIVIHGLPETLEALRKHVFNGQIWPDYLLLPNPEHPVLRMQEIRVGEVLDLGGRIIEALPADHVVPALGYRLEGSRGSLVFSGDTAFAPALLECLNCCENLIFLLLEVALPNEKNASLGASKHLSPNGLARMLSGLRRNPELYLTHLKPAFEQSIGKELEQTSLAMGFQLLRQGQVFIV